MRIQYLLTHNICSRTCISPCADLIHEFQHFLPFFSQGWVLLCHDVLCVVICHIVQVSVIDIHQYGVDIVTQEVRQDSSRDLASAVKNTVDDVPFSYDSYLKRVSFCARFHFFSKII